MVKKQSNVIELEESVRKQAESVKKGYVDMLELNKKLLTSSLSSLDMQIEMWLSMQLGFLDFMHSLTGFHPGFKGPWMGSHPYASQLEHLNELSSEFIGMKKKKAKLIADSVRKYQKKSFESTLEAFDKYCDFLSAA